MKSHKKEARKWTKLKNKVDQGDLLVPLKEFERGALVRFCHEHGFHYQIMGDHMLIFKKLKRQFLTVENLPHKMFTFGCGHRGKVYGEAINRIPYLETVPCPSCFQQEI